jgi:hypothetical protein
MAAALGIGPTATIEQVAALEEHCREHGTFQGQGCGAARDEDGVQRGAYWNYYKIAVPALGGRTAFVSFGHIQHGDHPLFSLDGKGFSYRRQGDLFVMDRSNDEER